jgi:replicative DNA helicase
MVGEPKRPSNIYAPQEVATLALDEVRACRNPRTHAVSLPLGERIGNIIQPLAPGKLCVIHAYTSNYKTGFATWWARKLARELQAQGDAAHCVAYVSWEDTVEDMGIFDLAHATRIEMSTIMRGVDDGQMMALEGAAMKRAALPLWVFGDTVGRGSKRPRMTMSHVEDCLGWLRESMAFAPAAIFLDYLNLIAPEAMGGFGKEGRRTDIMELTYRCRDLGIAHGCPVILLAQSGRQVNERGWKAPQKYDVLESSAVEQFSDTMLSLWMPVTTEPPSIGVQYLKDPEGNRTDKIIDEHLLIMTVNKAKRGRAGGWFALRVDPSRNELAPYTDEEAR